jgi:hypothetical protein
MTLADVKKKIRQRFAPARLLLERVAELCLKKPREQPREISVRAMPENSASSLMMKERHSLLSRFASHCRFTRAVAGGCGVMAAMVPSAW